MTVSGGSGGGTYNVGDTVTVTADIPSDKIFIGWKNGTVIVSTENPYTFTLNVTTKLTATFEDKPADGYCLLTVVNGTGSGSFAEGSTVTITAIVPTGKVFVWWKQGNNTVSTDNPYSFTLNSSTQLTAVFEDAPVADSVLAFTLIGNTYSVTGIGSASGNITVPATHNGRSVAAIADFAFFNCTTITKITVPSSVKSLGAQAFLNCTSLSTVTLSEGLTTIGDLAFNYCSSLSTINVPTSVTTIGAGAFSGCGNLASITLPFIGQSRVANGADALFGYVFGAQSYTGGVNTMQSYSDGTSSGTAICYIPSALKTVTITDIDKVPHAGFNNCNGITKISITSDYSEIGSYAFTNCAALLNFTVNDEVTSIGDYAFAQCKAAAKINISAQSILNYVGAGAFTECTALTSFYLPATVAEIGALAFKGCTAMQSMTLPFVGLKPDSTGNNSYVGAIFSVVTYGGEDLPASLTTLTVGGSRIEFSAFYNCKYLTTVTLTGDVTNISSQAFYKCSKLSKNIIPDTVTKVGAYAFYDCAKLLSVSLPEEVTNIEAYTFYGCTSLAEIDVSTRTAFIDERAFAYCAALTSVDINETLTSIGAEAFYNCSVLESIMIPAEITKLNASTFANCSMLSEVTFSAASKLSEISGSVFENCVSLNELAIPSSVKFISDKVLAGCSGLTTLTIPFVGNGKTDFSRVDVFGHLFRLSASEGCTATKQYSSSSYYNTYYIPSRLSEVTVTSGSRLYYGAFMNCVSLEKVVINAPISEVGTRAFEGCTALEEVEFNNDYNLGAICERAFADTALTDLYIPSGVLRIFAGAFAGSGVFTSAPANSVVYAGNWAVGLKGTLAGSITLIPGTVGLADSAFNGYAKLNSVSCPDSLKYIGDGAFANCTGITNVEIPGAVMVRSAAFSSCSALISINVPKTVTSIGAEAFFGCGALKSIVLPFVGASRTARDSDSLFGYIFGKSSFPGGTKTTQYYTSSNYVYSYIPNKLNAVKIDGATQISYGAFSGCDSLRVVDIAEGVAAIGKSVFYASGVEKVSFPESLQSIGANIFEKCTRLTELTLPFVGEARDADNETGLLGRLFSFGTYSFFTPVTQHNGTYTQTMYFPVSLRTITITDCSIITEGAFENCYMLTTVNLPAKLTSIGATSLKGCIGLTGITIPQNAYYSCENNSLVEKASNKLVKSLGDYIPNTISEIGAYAFERSALKSLTLPSGISYVGAGAFENCSLLTLYLAANAADTSSWDANWNISERPVFLGCITDSDGDREYVVSFTKSVDTTACFGNKPLNYPTRDGVLFTAWSTMPDGGGTVYYLANDSDYMIIPDLATIYSAWIPFYTYAFDTAGGSPVASQTVGAVLESPVTTQDGKYFAGWYDNPDCLGFAVIFPYESADGGKLTLYAKWSSTPVDGKSFGSAYNLSSLQATTILTSSEAVYYVFVAETTKSYTFESQGNVDTYISICYASQTIFANNDDSGVGYNFYSTVTLTAGAKYYVKITTRSSSIGSFTFTVK